MKKFMRIRQYLNATWVELISIEVVIEVGENETEVIKKALKDMKEIIFEMEKVTVYNETQAVIFNRLDGPVKLDIVLVTN